MQMGLPTSADNIEGLTVPVAGRTDSHKIDLIEVAYYNQSILDTANANYYSAEHLLVDSYEENKDEMQAAIGLFTDAATEISKAEQIYTEAINAQTEDERIELQKITLGQMMSKLIKKLYNSLTSLLTLLKTKLKQLQRRFGLVKTKQSSE